MSIFRLFDLLVFKGYKRVFFVLEYHRDISLAYIDKKKNFEKWLLLNQINGLTPLEKCQFSTVWTSSFYSLERRFFVLEYHERHFPGLYCLKKKTWKNSHFWSKTMG